MLWLLFLVGLAVLFYYSHIKPQLYWKARNVPQRFPIPFLGDQANMIFKLETKLDMIQKIYNINKKARYVGMYHGTIPILMLRDSELIQQVTVKHFDHFVDRLRYTMEDNSIFHKNLFCLKGDSWRKMRATLSPTFTSSKMKSMFVLMNKSAEQYVNFYLEKKQDTLEIELKDSFARCTNDVIANCIFGLTIDSLQQPENDFYVTCKRILAQIRSIPTFKILIEKIFPKITNFVELNSEPRTDFFKTIVAETVRNREENNIYRPDMIHLLMEAKKGRLKNEETPTEQRKSGFATAEESDIGKQELHKTELTNADMVAQLVLFVLAGYDTVSTVMASLCYELAVHPDIQNRLTEEIDTVRRENNGKLAYDMINKMKYLDMVISEGLRKNPPEIAFERVCTKAYTIESERPGEKPLHLKPGDMIVVPIGALHHDELYFPNPSKFDPERFSDENRHTINRHAYIPFGSGPRSCIASRFALMECKSLMFHILSNFELNVIDKTTIPIKLDKNSLIPIMEGGFWIGFQRRNK